MGEQLEITSGAGTQGWPAVAFNAAAGEWLVMWEDTRSGNYDLYGQRVDRGGLVGGEIALWVGSGGNGGPAPSSSRGRPAGPPGLRCRRRER